MTNTPATTTKNKLP